MVAWLAGPEPALLPARCIPLMARLAHNRYAQLSPAIIHDVWVLFTHVVAKSGSR